MLAVAELMRRDIAVAHPGVPVRRIIELMATMDVEGVLVADRRGRVIGSIGDEKLIASLHAARSSTAVPWSAPCSGPISSSNCPAEPVRPRGGAVDPSVESRASSVVGWRGSL